MSYKRVEIARQEIEGQQEIMARVRAQNDLRGAPPLALVDTYGCQQNEADSERLRGMLREMGYDFTADEYAADLIVINTCAVREHAEMRVLGNVGALTHTKRKKPGQIIALCGCMVQEPSMAEKIRRSYRHVDLVFGPHALWRLPEFLERILTEKGRVFATEDDPGAIMEGLPVQRDGSVKAWLSIMYGCNNFCAYCIVPYVRGRERSRTPEHILAEARALIAEGYKDITLLGQNVNSYGRDLDADIDFSDLLRNINALPGDFVLRFMTSHPKDAGEKLFQTLAECEKVERHLHLPFQAGSDRVLSAMNRGYTKAEYLALIESARRHVPDIVLTSDIIVGFPGETYAEFCDTLDVIRTVRFDALFTFIYSRRPGTPAADMPDDTPKEEKQRRFQMLVDLQNEISEEVHRAYIGQTVRVLVDGDSGDARYPFSARTSGGRLVRVAGDCQIGEFSMVKITGSSTWALSGEII